MKLFGRRRFDADLKEELGLHLAEREAAYVRDGMAPADARRRAALEFGNVAAIHEQSRDVWLVRWLEHLKRDARIAVRMLRRAPGFTVAAVATLALGIGANATIFTVADAVLLRPLPYRDGDRLVMFGDRNAAGMPGNIGFETWLDYRAASRTLESTSIIRSWFPTLVVDGTAERLPAMRVSASYFSMLGVTPALGRDFKADEDTDERWRVLMLSDGLWRRRFNADPNVIGRSVRMNDRDYQIVGVLPASFEPIDSARFYQPAELYAVLGYEAGGDSSCRGCQHLKTIGRLRPGATIADAEGELNVIRARLAAQYPGEYRSGTTVAVATLRDIVAGPVRTPVLVLLGAVAFVLLMACANVASLLVARLMNRDREMALRSALGAGRARLTSQLLIESVVLAASGGAAGLALAAVLLSAVARLAPESLPRVSQMAVDGRVLLFTLGASLATAVAFGLLPAFRASRADLRGAMNAEGRTTAGGGAGARRALIAADLALALVLLAGAGLMLKSVSALLRTEPGFDPANTLTLQFSLVGQAYAEDPAVRAFQDRVLQQVRALPGVEHAALTGQIPLGGNYDGWGFQIEGKPDAGGDGPSAERFSVTPEYFSAMRIPILRGRGIADTDTATSEPVMVIAARTATELFPGEDPIGRRARIGDSRPWMRIVGIVGDVRHRSLDGPPNTQMYLPQSQLTDSYLVIVVRTRTERPEQLTPAIRDIVRSLDPSVPIYEVATMASLVERGAARQRFVMRLLVGFAGIALVLAAVGLYGVISYAVARRAREVGVRMALGASPRDIVGLVIAGGSRAIGVGIAAGVAGALLLTRYLGTLLYGVDARDPATLLAAVIVLLAVALAAHVIPLRRAIRIDPATALRQE